MTLFSALQLYINLDLLHQGSKKDPIQSQLAFTTMLVWSKYLVGQPVRRVMLCRIQGAESTALWGG